METTPANQTAREIYDAAIRKAEADYDAALGGVPFNDVIGDWLNGGSEEAYQQHMQKEREADAVRTAAKLAAYKIYDAAVNG